ncbi:hypothetical protein [Desulfosporosinus nitroreducens]|uniref:DUF4352 domain-containing protein n=1 Tax=Desulfosporosinus nitroreducens TaxID=2018668 RepID=A0ABT8QXH3_9FIRM|nr:hypothetical protein [Desulfosporosinus nitroreducens]MDO0826040.1 hypothetical protein [Desulfosporosinus nitroreducens]
MKITRQAIISVLLIFFAIFLGHTTETGFSIGDKILLGFGISPWSNGQTGFHYPIIIYFVLFIIGCLEARRVMSSRQLIVLLLLVFIITPSVVSLVKPVYFRMQSGLATVEYDARNSSFNIRSSLDNEKLETIGAISLTNYGNNPIEFGIKIPSDSFIAHEWFSEDLILTRVENSEDPGTFILYPGQRQTILSYTTIPWKNGNNGTGTMNGLNLILFSNNENRKVGYNL